MTFGSGPTGSPRLRLLSLVGRVLHCAPAAIPLPSQAGTQGCASPCWVAGWGRPTLRVQFLRYRWRWGPSQAPTVGRDGTTPGRLCLYQAGSSRSCRGNTPLKCRRLRPTEILSLRLLRGHGGSVGSSAPPRPGPKPTTHCLVSGDTDGRLGRREKGTVTVCGQHGVLSEVTRVKSCSCVVSRRTLRVFPNSKEGDVCPSALFLEGRTRNIWLVPLSTPIAT